MQEVTYFISVLEGMAISKNVLIIIALLVALSIVEIGILVEISIPDFPVRPYLQK